MRRPTARPHHLSAIPPYPPLRGSGLVDAFRHAWRGLVHTVVHQRNMRIHVVAATLVGLVGMGIPLGLAEKVTLIFCVLFVFFAEILNSALEQLVDLAIQQFDEKARLTKDAAAAGVFVLATGTVVIFAAILVHNWSVVVTHVPQIERVVALGLPLACCAGTLTWTRPKPWGLEVGAFLVGCGLLIALSLRTESYVFCSLTAGVFVLCGAAARERSRGG